MNKIKDISGQKWNRLTAIKFISKCPKNGQRWLWRCDCGKEKEILLNSVRQKNGSKSCGCYRDEQIRKGIKETNNYGQITHGLSNHPLYGVWTQMNGRCYNPYHKKYMDYGGRGIKVCDEWKYNITNFYNWAINNGYEKGLCIDRINNEGSYEPNNCRWVDYEINNNNQRRSYLGLIHGWIYDSFLIQKTEYKTILVKI